MATDQESIFYSDQILPFYTFKKEVLCFICCQLFLLLDFNGQNNSQRIHVRSNSHFKKSSSISLLNNPPSRSELNGIKVLRFNTKKRRLQNPEIVDKLSGGVKAQFLKISEWTTLKINEKLEAVRSLKAGSVF